MCDFVLKMFLLVAGLTETNAGSCGGGFVCVVTFAHKAFIRKNGLQLAALVRSGVAANRVNNAGRESFAHLQGEQVHVFLIDFVRQFFDRRQFERCLNYTKLYEKTNSCEANLVT
jgi:hypothetical protein